MTAVIVSFCNLQPRFNAFSLARVDLASGAVDFVDLRDLTSKIPFIGITGLCHVGDHIAIGVQGPISALAILDRNLSLVDFRYLSKVQDIHSLTPRGHDLLIASTKTNEIVAYDTRTGVETILYAAAPAEAGDTHHLNAVCVYQDQVYACMFGQTQPGRTRAGRIVNIHSGETVLDGLRQPHSLTATGDSMLVLESSTGHLIKFGTDFSLIPWIEYAGYVRGLCPIGDLLVIGRSVKRAWSRSQNALLPITVSLPSPDGYQDGARSALFIRDAGGTDRALDVSDAGSEIYDILALSDHSAQSILEPPIALAYKHLRRHQPRQVEPSLHKTSLPDTTTSLLVADAKHATADLEGAAQTLRAAPANGAAGVEIKRFLGEILRKQGKLDEAVATLADAQAEAPDNVHIRTQLSACYMQLGRLDEAEAQLRAALAIRPSAAGYWNQYSGLLVRLNRLQDALEASSKAVSLADPDAAFLTQKARILRLLHRLEDSRACFIDALRIDPANAHTRHDYGLTLHLLNDLPASIDQHRRAAALDPARDQFRKRAEAMEHLLAKRGQ
jgi:tetratricopeptide (TPR) repeat protein